MKDKKIPKLPFGQGSITEFNDTTLVYKKMVTLPNGKKVRKAVYGITASECMDKMRQLETDLQKQIVVATKQPLADAIIAWYTNVKKPTLKSQTQTRLLGTINNQIIDSDIGHFAYQEISSDEIQALINTLNQKRYSKSTIKKTYDCLNEFYRYASIKYQFNNPMLLVTMPISDNIKAEERQIVWFEDEDIKKFIDEAHAKYHTGTLKYHGSLAYAANIYLGLRGGELLALQWKDIDFNKNTVYVCKTLIEEANPDYNPNVEGSHKIRYVIQNSTKRRNTRYVPINSKAKALLLEHLNESEYKDPNDLVVCSRNRHPNTIKHINTTIRQICENADTTVQNASSHTLRHTCASLYFRKGVPIETIAKILGHSVDVCRATYLHFVEEQLQEAASKIDVIEI